MLPEPFNKPHFVGPHEGRELDLMVAGVKPLSMFVEPIQPEFEYFPEQEFDSMVSCGKLVKCVSREIVKEPNGKENEIRRVLYALPTEEWRIKSILLVSNLYDSLLPGWRPDLDRLIGLLLGYRREDIEQFLEFVSPSATAPPRCAPPGT